MTIKEIINKDFKDSKKLLELRLKSSKIMFIFCSLTFFLNFFFIGANFYYDFFIKTISFTYIIFLISFFLLTYFYLKDRLIEKIGNISFHIIMIILAGLFILSYIPFTI